MKLLADVSDIFGKVNPPPAPAGINTGTAAEGLGRLITIALRLTFSMAGVFLLIYGLWGGFRWVIAEGDKEKLAQARNQIRDAFLGILVLAVTLAVFRFVTGDIIHIFDFENNGLQFKLPPF
ncbi:MAG: hypothetical protein ACMG6E_01040 [Candidatus Roizmanbacteria bacterium]